MDVGSCKLLPLPTFLAFWVSPANTQLLVACTVLSHPFTPSTSRW